MEACETSQSFHMVVIHGMKWTNVNLHTKLQQHKMKLFSNPSGWDYNMRFLRKIIEYYYSLITCFFLLLTLISELHNSCEKMVYNFILLYSKSTE